MPKKIFPILSKKKSRTGAGFTSLAAVDPSPVPASTHTIPAVAHDPSARRQPENRARACSSRFQISNCSSDFRLSSNKKKDQSKKTKGVPIHQAWTLSPWCCTVRLSKVIFSSLRRILPSLLLSISNNTTTKVGTFGSIKLKGRSVIT